MSNEDLRNDWDALGHSDLTPSEFEARAEMISGDCTSNGWNSDLIDACYSWTSFDYSNEGGVAYGYKY